jgi:sulfopropanediol 3-dehydrogenase
MYEDTVRPDNNFHLSEQEIERALANTPKEVRDDISASQNNIRRFALQQRATMKDLSWEDPEQPGVVLGHRHIPIERVGMYIPGGRYPHIAAASM